MAMTAVWRTREIGIRIALGARKNAVIGLLLGEQLRAVVSTRAVKFVESYLYQLTIYDSRVWAITVGLIVATAVLSGLIPLLRASRADPIKRAAASSKQGPG
jgi:macrolide transport system ATP-binding/permease protein